MNILLIILGILFFFWAGVFLFRTGLIFKINTWMKEYVFSDQVALFSKRRMAILLFILGGVALFSGIEGIMEDDIIRPRIAASLIQLADENFQKGEYQKAIKVSAELLRSNPKNIPALKILAKSYWSLVDKKQALSALKIILALSPHESFHDDPVLQLIYKESQLKK